MLGSKIGLKCRAQMSGSKVGLEGRARRSGSKIRLKGQTRRSGLKVELKGLGPIKLGSPKISPNQLGQGTKVSY